MLNLDFFGCDHPKTQMSFPPFVTLCRCVLTLFMSGPSSTGFGHRRAVLSSGKALRAESAHGGAGCTRENREDHQRRAAESRRQPRFAGTLFIFEFKLVLL